MQGLSRSVGEIVPAVDAMAAPAIDHTRAIVLAITAIGPAGVLDTALGDAPSPWR